MRVHVYTHTSDSWHSASLHTCTHTHTHEPSLPDDLMLDSGQPCGIPLGISSVRGIMAALASLNATATFLPIYLSLTSRSTLHVHKMPTLTVAMAAPPSFPSISHSVLIRAIFYPSANLSSRSFSLFLPLSLLSLPLSRLPAGVKVLGNPFSWPCFPLCWLLKRLSISVPGCLVLPAGFTTSRSSLL